MEYTRRHLTTSALARYVLETMGKPHARTALLLTKPRVRVIYIPEEGRPPTPLGQVLAQKGLVVDKLKSLPLAKAVDMGDTNISINKRSDEPSQTCRNYSGGMEWHSMAHNAL